MILWYCQDEAVVEQTEKIERFYRDREFEFETGEIVLPSWASLGDVAALYGDATDDGASPYN